mgnify:CR=1 FL=1
MITFKTEVFIIKDIITASLTALLNVRSFDTLKILHNIDDRVNTGKIKSETELSFQVLNAYYLYLEYLPILDLNQYEKYER